MVFLRLENGNSSCRQAGFLIIADHRIFPNHGKHCEYACEFDSRPEKIDLPA